jgi:hypothetical protein
MNTAKTKVEPQHTPTPWARNVSPAAKYPFYASATGDHSKKDWIHIGAVLDGNPNAEADLDFIIRAVNVHEELLRAAKELVRQLEARFIRTGCNAGEEIAMREIRTAIAKASASDADTTEGKE